MLIVDESHVTVPQIGGMERGDHARKSILSEFGFRLPSCIDNRPLKFEEWEHFRPQTIFVSATPGPWELERVQGVFAEQVIRPTGLIDPVTEIRPVEHQVDDLLAEIRHHGDPRRPHPGHHPDQADGGGSDRLPDRTRHQGALSALRRGHAGAHRDHPRPAAGRVRRADRHQPAARGAGHPGMRAGGDPGRGQGGVPAQPDQPDADDRPRRAQRGRPGDPVCRRDDATACATRWRRPRAAGPSRRPGTRRTASPRPACASRSARR